MSFLFRRFSSRPKAAVSVTDFAALLSKPTVNVIDTVLNPGQRRTDIAHPNTASQQQADDSLRRRFKERVASLESHEREAAKMRRTERGKLYSTEGTFAEFPFQKAIIEVLRNQNLVYPTAIQSGLCKEWFGVKRRDILVKAQTGTGKSLGYIALLYNDLLDMQAELLSDNSSPLHIVIVPNALLAEQLGRWLRLLEVPDDHVALFVGDADKEKSQYARAKIVIGTGGQLHRLQAKGLLSTDQLRTVIVDEADAVIKPLRRFATDKEHKCRAKHPVPSQLFLSEIISSKKDCRLIYISATLNALLRTHLKKNDLVRPGAIYLEAGDDPDGRAMHSSWECPKSIQHHHRLTDGDEEVLGGVLAEIIQGREEGKRGIILLAHDQSKQRILSLLVSHGVETVLLSECSGSSQLNNHLLLASDADIRGLDIHPLDYVVIIGLPESTGHYVHMAGRVGRMGREGRVYTILPSERCLHRHLAGLTALLRVTSIPF